MEKKNIIIGVACCLVVFFVFTTVYSSIKSYQARRLCNQLTERINDAEDTNRRLEKTIGQCQSICNELTESVERNINTANDAIELIEEIRTQVGNLQTITGDFDWDSYYNNLDSYLQVEQLTEY